MKFAVVVGERQEAEPGLSAECPACTKAVIAKCGELRRWHWAHRGTRTCDPWWEPETEWHRTWKDRFPKDRQEIGHTSAQGEKHIADVKTEHGLVLEFQHSFLHRDEREARQAFYPKLVWVVDGRRRVRDRRQFFTLLGDAAVLNREPLIVGPPSNEGALMRDWGGGGAPVYFDFGDNEPLWRLSPNNLNGRQYLSPVQKAEFLRIYLEGLPFDENYAEAVGHLAALRLARQAPQPQPPNRFDWYMARQRSRRRF